MVKPMCAARAKPKNTEGLLALEIQRLGLADVPAEFVTREGVSVGATTDTWVVALPTLVKRIYWNKIEDDFLRWTCKRYAMHLMQSVSTSEGDRFSRVLSEQILPRLKKTTVNRGSLEKLLVMAMEDAIKALRAKQRLWQIYSIVRWYVWCADRFPELGFWVDYADELDRMVIPGGPKGEAVRSNDPEEGPLDRTLELPILLKALNQDSSQAFAHVEERAALALCIAMGRNPANFVFLEEEDLVNITEAVPDIEPCYILKVPRIKKRQLSPRDVQRDVPIDVVLAKHIVALKAVNPRDPVSVYTTDGDLEVEFRPLFRRPIGCTKAVPRAVIDRAARCPSDRINVLLKQFVKRMNIVSPISGELILITPRRLRYTFGSGLAEEGISRRELANLLDHTDTQHVGVYFELKHRIVRHLDAAVAKKFSGMLNFFKGKVIQDPGDEPNGILPDKRVIYVNQKNPLDQEDIGVCGKKALCHLDPPFSCYLCEKFRPLLHANHQRVLDCMLVDREDRLKKYEDSRLGVQLDDVIFAVAQVVELCGQEVTHG